VKIRPSVIAVGNDKKKGKVGKVSHNLGLYFSYMGNGPPWTNFGRVEGAHDVIILSNFGFNIFRRLRSTGG